MKCSASPGMRCRRDSIACELKVGSAPVPPNSSRWLTTVMRGPESSSQGGIWSSVTRKIRRIQGANAAIERSEYRSSSRLMNRDWLVAMMLICWWPSAARAAFLRRSQSGSPPSTQVYTASMGKRTCSAGAPANSSRVRYRGPASSSGMNGLSVAAPTCRISASAEQGGGHLVAARPDDRVRRAVRAGHPAPELDLAGGSAAQHGGAARVGDGEVDLDAAACGPSGPEAAFGDVTGEDPRTGQAGRAVQRGEGAGTVLDGHRDGAVLVAVRSHAEVVDLRGVQDGDDRVQVAPPGPGGGRADLDARLHGGAPVTGPDQVADHGRRAQRPLPGQPAHQPEATVRRQHLQHLEAAALRQQAVQLVRDHADSPPVRSGIPGLTAEIVSIKCLDNDPPKFIAIMGTAG
nr:hypothetical protein GCM10020092_061790 [Actinoplanes digitatis]